MEASAVWYSVTVLFVAFVGLFGLGLLFVRATWIERNTLVGSLTFLTACLAGFLLYRGAPNAITTFGLLSIALVSITGFLFGRAVDWWMGGEFHSDDTRNATLGADLAD